VGADLVNIDPPSLMSYFFGEQKPFDTFLVSILVLFPNGA